MEKTWLRQCDGMGMHGFQWHWVIGVYCWCDRREKKPEDRRVYGYTLYPHSTKCRSWLDSTSQYRWTMTQNILQTQPRRFWRYKSGMFSNGQVDCLISNVFHLLKIKLKAERPTNKQQLKTSLFRCVWLALELNSAGKWTLRAPNTEHFACQFNQIHLIQVISSLVEIPSPNMGVSDKGDMQNVQCWGAPGTWLWNNDIDYLLR